jgi:beta-lactamase regulating signal transducer with metallopeptidase domain
MNAVFLKILNMSIAASWLIAVVILIRFLLKKAPKWISCVLWALVALRLLIPFSFESSLSLLPSGETISYKNVTAEEPAADPVKSDEPAEAQTPSGGRASSSRILVIDTGIPAIDDTLNPAIEKTYRNRQAAPAENTAAANETAPAAQKTISAETWTLIAVVVWITGIIGLLVYALITYLKLRMKTSASIHVRGRIWAADDLKTPFILGVLRPAIYVPSFLGGEELEYVLAHEEAHLARRDHWWKPLGYLILAVYWFNPLCWLAYILLCRDIEAACDEKAIKEMNRDEVANYSQTLLNLSVQRRQIAACPLAFGEVGVKQRIKGILNYKKPAFWVILVALIACVVVGICFLTNPKKHTEPTGADTETTEPVTDPTKEPTQAPTQEPTEAPTQEPTENPTEPSDDPSGTIYEGAKAVFLNDPQVLFTIPVNQGEGSLTTGILIDDGTPAPSQEEAQISYYDFGPDAFALRSESEIIVLDKYFNRVLRFRKDYRTEILQLDLQEIGQLYGELLLWEDNVYVIGSKGVLRWNLRNGQRIFFPGDFDPQKEDLWVMDLVWDDGLVICNSLGKNLKLDEASGAFSETGDGYRLESYAKDDDAVVITSHSNGWVIPKQGGFVMPVSQGPEKTFFVVSSKMNEDGKMDYFLRQYGLRQSGEMGSAQYPAKDKDSIWYYPAQMAYAGTHGVYALLVEKDVAKVVKYVDFEYEEGYAPENESDFIRGLRETDPEVLEVKSGNGLIVAVAMFAEDVYYCRLIPGGRSCILLSETRSPFYTPGEMQEILATYDLNDDKISVRYYQDPLSSWVYVAGEEEQVLQKISAQFDDRYHAGFLSVGFDDQEIAKYEEYDPYAVRIDLSFNEVLSCGQEVSGADQKKIAAFLTEGKDGMTISAWDYLLQSYRDPSEIDLITLSYGKGTEENLSQEEIDAVWAETGWKEMLPTTKRTYEALNGLFVKLTGQELSEAQKKEFLRWIYVPEYDAYYSHTSDAPYDLPVRELGRMCRLSAAAAQILGIEENAEEMIAVEWTSFDWAPKTTGMAILVPNGDGWTIRENLLLRRCADSAKIATSFDKVLSEGKALDSAELEKINAFFQKDTSAYPMYFIRQSYSDPSAIDLSLLFINGIDNDLSAEEIHTVCEAAGFEDEAFTPQAKVTVEQMDELLGKYTSRWVKQEQLKDLWTWHYVSEYDAYYSFKTDAPDDLGTHTLGRGCRLDSEAAKKLGINVSGKELIAVEWIGGGVVSPAVTGMVILIPNGDSYKIAANLVFE